MDVFEKIYINEIYLISFNLSRSTIKEAYKFRKIIEEVIYWGHTDLIIDLSKCDYFNSTFFGGIIWILTKITNIGKKPKLIKPSNPKEDIFLTTNTTRFFDIYETREDALKSFGEGILPESQK